MTTTLAVSVKLPTNGDAISTEGPIVLAAKPFDLTNAPLAMARWLARREDRELCVFTIVEAHDALGGADGVATLPARYYEEERASIAERLEDELQLQSADDVVYRITVENGPGARTDHDEASVALAREIDDGTSARPIFDADATDDAIGRLQLQLVLQPFGNGGALFLVVTSRKGRDAICPTERVTCLDDGENAKLSILSASQPARHRQRGVGQVEWLRGQNDRPLRRDGVAARGALDRNCQCRCHGGSPTGRRPCPGSRTVVYTTKYQRS